jgi:Protein RETICULATA-related
MSTTALQQQLKSLRLPANRATAKCRIRKRLGPPQCFRLVVVTLISLMTLMVVQTQAYQQGTATSIAFFPLQRWNDQLQKGYQRRVAADPAFASKSVTEVLVAAGTQFTAEWNRRGAHRLLPELDFVVPAILTAVIGKYYR